MCVCLFSASRERRAKAEMEKKRCGACSDEINDLEPMRCGFCEAVFHIQPQCIGFNLRTHKEAFSKGAVMFICPQCKSELRGRSVRAYIADLNSPQADSGSSNGLALQLQQLSGLVEGLSKKVDNITSTQARNIAGSPLSGGASGTKTPLWPRLSGSIKRPRNDFAAPPPNRGTKQVNFDNLSVASFMPAAPPPTFWLYLSGFHPMVTDDDVKSIVSQCLDAADVSNVTRLVAKGTDVSKMSFVSFKVGLDPALKPLALNAENWPAGLLFREFLDQSKNTARRTFITSRDNAPTLEIVPAVPQGSPVVQS